jgi:hypothetical protein
VFSHASVSDSNTTNVISKGPVVAGETIGGERADPPASTGLSVVWRRHDKTLTNRRSPQCVDDVCLREVVTFVQQREPTRLRQSIGGAITEIEARRMPSFAEASKSRAAVAG